MNALLSNPKGIDYALCKKERMSGRRDVKDQSPILH